VHNATNLDGNALLVFRGGEWLIEFSNIPIMNHETELPPLIVLPVESVCTRAHRKRAENKYDDLTHETRWMHTWILG